LAQFTNELRPGVLKKSEFGSCTSDAAPRGDALVLRSAADSAVRVGRRKRVSFASLISIRNITPYCEVYGIHPREFDFDNEGRKVCRHRSHLAPHMREIRVRDSNTILSRLSADLLLLQASGIQSQEEEFELTTDITRRRKRRETSRDDKIGR